MEKHGGQKGKGLLQSRELHGDHGIGVPAGDNSVQEEGLFELGPLGYLPDEGKDVHGNDGYVDQREMF